MDLTSVTKRMDRFRSRLRNLYLASGVSRVLFGLGVLLLLSFLLDYFLDLPIAVRYASALTALLVIGVIFLRTVLYPLSVHLSDDDLALAAEARLPEFRDRLISALQFRRQIEDPENTESPEMMRIVIEEAGRLEQAVEINRLLDSRVVRRHALLATAAFAVLFLIVAVAPSTAGIWARRNLLLTDIPWPHSTILVVEGFPESGERVVTRGESLRIDVRARGKIPNDVEIRFARIEGEGNEEDRRRMYQTEDEPDLFRFEFRQIPASFQFWVVGGDDPDGEPVYTVRALIPPTIEEIQASCRFPEYSRLEPETFREADLDVPEGTAIGLSFRLNMPLRSAVIVRTDGEPLALTLSPDRRTATVDLTADRTFEYELEFTGEDGQRNLPSSAAFRIRAVPDRKPLVRILHPAARPWHTTKALIPFKVLASDNFGVSEVTLFMKKDSEDEFSPRVFTAAEFHAADEGRQFVCYAAIPAAELVADQENPVRVGDEITYYAEAVDNNGNMDRSDRYRIEIVSEEDLERQLSQRQTDLREDALKSGQKQGRAHTDVRSLVDFVAEGGELVAADRDQLREIQIRQGIVTRDMDQFFSAVSRVFNAYVYNRLAKPSATERILLLFDDFLRSDHEELSTVFKRDLYESLIEEYRAGRIYDMQILAVLIEIMEISMKIGERTSPEAHRLLTGLARGEPEKGVREDLAHVEALQTDILADFRLLDRKMQRWESYAELIEFLREVKTIQGDVKSGAESILNEGGRNDPK